MGGVVVGGGDEAPEIMAVGDEHEDSLDQNIQTLATWQGADNQLTLLEDPRRLSGLAGQTKPVALVLNSRGLAHWNPKVALELALMNNLGLLICVWDYSFIICVK